MTPALEYLIRTGLIRDWLELPCSLFLRSPASFRKLVVTISEEFKPSDHYSVKHWLVCEGVKDNALPSMHETRVRKDELFTHPFVIVPGYRLAAFPVPSIPCEYNSYKKPMDANTYGYFFDNAHGPYSQGHQTRRRMWLWQQYTSIHHPNLSSSAGYIDAVFCSESERAQRQMQAVFHADKRSWLFWQKWCQYMLYTSAEMIFYKEYLKNV